MSYEVPNSPALAKRRPHWYIMATLAFHGLVIVRGITMLSTRSFIEWRNSQQLLLIFSVIIAVISLMSWLQRGTGSWVVACNVVYSVLIVPSSLMHTIVGSLGPTYIFYKTLDLVLFIVLMNILYTLYRISSTLYRVVMAKRAP